MVMTTKTIRPEPEITDHQVFRKIGEGAYGEVWLAQAVTGAMRAVKVVYREDFDDEVGFEREFEGILRYEPISRDHPSLMNILHVGRNEKKGFYYYVMELGDDVHSGSEIHPIEYEARTLRSDMLSAKGEVLDVHFCLETGERLALALEHLHEGGLAHRDVKPSNIIFVEGKAKLADIGLVAARGQRTFVGTEGFVPPEGPGSAQADVYSLGKVLYEMATGKDRLEFPELPDELPSSIDRKLWLALNQVICDICDPKVSQRTIVNAAQLADAMQRLQEGKRLHRRRSAHAKKVITYSAILACVFVAIFLWRPWNREAISQSEGNEVKVENTQALETQLNEPKTSIVTINTFPSGAGVYDLEGEFQGYTPLVEEMQVGSEFTYRFEKEGYRSSVENFQVNNIEYFDRMIELDTYRPPVDGLPWSDSLNQVYQPRDNHHISNFIGGWRWLQFQERSGVKTGPSKSIQYSLFGKEREIILTSQADAAAYCQWLTDLGRESGHLSEDHYIIARRELEFSADQYTQRDKKAGLRPFRCVVKLIPYARLEVVTDPPGADVFIEGEARGVSPCIIEKLKPGWVDITVSLEGYERHEEGFVIKNNDYKNISVSLNPNHGVVFGRSWKNGLGQTLVPVGDIMVSEHEVTVRNYRRFINQRNYTRPRSAGFPQEDDHPVVGVTREDAEQFCSWLTKKERSEQRIATNHSYRLPTDAEWSKMADLEEELLASPADQVRWSLQDEALMNTFSWGSQWPIDETIDQFGNVGDLAAAQSSEVSITETLLNYDDGFMHTSPVKSFRVNGFELYGMGGNVQEWVEDDYNSTGNYEVARGAGWKSYLESHLRLIYREVLPKGHADNHIGFRIVLVREPVGEEDISNE